MTDAHWLREFAATGSEDAFTGLVSRHAGIVHAAARRQTGNPHLTEEVTQAVFVLLARKASSLSPQTLLIGWLLRATRYAAADLMRSERRRLARETSAHQMNETLDFSSPDETRQMWDRVAPVLDGCLADLRKPDRNALLLRFFQDQSLAEVGAALGIAEDAARKRVSRAMEALRSEMQRHGVMAPLAMIPGLLSTQAVSPAPSGLVGTTVSAALGPIGNGGARAVALSKSVAWEMTWSGLRVWFATVGTALGLLGGGIWAGKALWERDRVSSEVVDGDYRAAGFEDPGVVHQFIRDLQRRIRAGEREAVAGLVRYPLKVNGAGRGDSGSIAAPAALLSSFEHVFTESVAGEILKCPAQCLHCTVDGVMIGGGSVWVAPEPGSGEPRIALVNLP